MIMRRSEFAGAAAIAAAIAGAGFASGREIVAFFTRFGVAGYVGATLAAGLIGWMARETALIAARTGTASFPGLMRLCAGRAWGSGALMWLMSIAVSGAMTAAGGELCALAINIHGARQIGMVCTAALAALCAARGVKLMGAVGAFTVAALIGYYVLLLCVSPELPEYTWRPGAVLSAAAYAGFNIATACGAIFASGLRIKSDVHRRANALGAYTGAFMLAMLLVALACVRLHGSASAAALPSVIIASQLGKPGYYMTICVMWLAVMSTLAGALLTLEMQGRERNLRSGDVRLIALSLPVLIGCAGFETLVDRAYPVLGLVCAAYMAVAILRGMRVRWEANESSLKLH